MNTQIKTQTIGDFFIRRLHEAGIGHIFGVPGDFTLQFLQQLADRGEPEWVGCCNELNASYAADGYARIHGLSALSVTFGVGALSAINGIAGAYSEHVPLICICGSLPQRAIERRTMMHHTLGDGWRNPFLRAFQQVTVAQAQITPQNAVEEIDRMIVTAWRVKRPVYVELPSDISYLEINTPEAPLQLKEPESDSERLSSCVQAIVQQLATARYPAILLDMDAERFRVLDEVKKLAEKKSIPVVTLGHLKGCFSEQHPLFAGTYKGDASNAFTRKIVEESDCLITVGYRRIDATSGFFTDRLPKNAIQLEAYTAEIDNDHYEAITLRDVLVGTTALIDPVTSITSYNNPKSLKAPAFTPANTALKQSEFWILMQEFIRPDDLIIAEIGTAAAGGGSLHLRDGCTYITQSVWGSVGYTLGALLGTLKAAPHRRQILLIGDGSFQLTAQELSTVLRQNLKPVIFLINNGGYTIERTILGLHETYNDVANWNYADLPKVFSRKPVATHSASTAEALHKIMQEIGDEFTFIEVVMAKDDASAGFIKAGHACAELDYGPRGPQSRANIRIPIPDADTH